MAMAAIGNGMQIRTAIGRKKFRTDRVIIEALDDSRFELDGEIIEDRYLDIKVVPNKLKMFM